MAQKVLAGKTAGYKKHPQLARFKKHLHPGRAIASYLLSVLEESERRNYLFDKSKIGKGRTGLKIPVTHGQVRYEFQWLCKKLKKRCPEKYRIFLREKKIRLHPLFRLVPGNVEEWEKIKG